MAVTLRFLCALKLSFAAVVIGTSTKKSPLYNNVIRCPIQYGYVANPTLPCDHWFYQCDDYIGYRQPCPTVQFFDPEINKCDSWYNVPVCSGVNRTKISPTTKRSPAKSYDDSLFDCTKKSEGNYPDENAEIANCSNTYFTCSVGEKIVNRCHYGFYYDRRHNWCETFENVLDCVNGTRKPAVPTPAWEQDSYDYYFDCANKVDDIYPNPHENCSRHYYICLASVAYELDCDEKLYYNAETHSCDKFENIFECTAIRKTTSDTEILKLTTVDQNSSADLSTTNSFDLSSPSAVSIKNVTTVYSTHLATRISAATTDSIEPLHVELDSDSEMKSSEATTIEALHVMDEESSDSSTKSTEVTTMEPLHVMDEDSSNSNTKSTEITTMEPLHVMDEDSSTSNTKSTEVTTIEPLHVFP